MSNKSKVEKVEKVEEVKNQEVKNFTVDAKVLQATINYLGEQPFKQVANLIGALQQSKPE